MWKKSKLVLVHSGSLWLSFGSLRRFMSFCNSIAILGSCFCANFQCFLWLISIYCIAFLPNYINMCQGILQFYNIDIS